MFGVRQTIGWDVESSEDRFDHARQEQGVRFSVQDICAFTGLHRNSVVPAIDVLNRVGLFEMKPIAAARWYFVVIHLDVLLAQSLCNSSEQVAQTLCNLRHKKCATSKVKLPKKCAGRERLIGRQILKETTATNSVDVAVLKTETSQQDFERLEKVLGKPLGGPARRRILQAAEVEEFELYQLAFAFGREGGGIKEVGGLIQFAEAWRLNTAHILKWPCPICLDAGVINFPESPFSGQGPCQCRAGDLAKQERFGLWEQWQEVQAAGKPFCIACANTGRLLNVGVNTDWELNDGIPFCTCETGRGAHREFREQQRRSKELQAGLEAKGLCADCEGKGTNAEAKRCWACRGTGSYYSDENLKAKNLCTECWGTRKSLLSDAKNCGLCGGTGCGRASAGLTKPR